ncbi:MULTISPECIES: SDR family NAD(P)-dependent oxidoreductase [unclassified Novosphingobium]|uniref:SDR family NAD(P)-dependent oxidoreductase n=1 Tax=Novosphingobium TaxID=165696 RepID=UPI00146C0F7D|nr:MULTISPECIES: SDR family NAD(P)-dependent oxidoreductase [unclassified Novosphingobium]NMN06871.1 NAD(P)-dependent dehydrogenase (short-subunit alcohol dehydrogenase family) [Novosphingobium sp. SG919]NMN89542.1 NAD(P)-dependent dehydrogenase (short-subunit alcohol dehydrogenase family) [Novosphingobium sp. SG916]
MKDFAGRTAFVTGGANGVGIGLVRQLLNEGCKVAIADIRQDSIDKALASLDNREVMGVQLDVSSREAFRDAADRVEAEFGPVSLLFNNAGVNLFQPIEESSYDDWDWLLGVNLHGVINGVMTFVPRMVERVKAGTQKGGHITNTASMAAFLAAGTPGIYNTTKFAVRGLSESLHYSLLQYGIGVSVLCPGLVKSYIYASDAIRPDGLKAGAKPVNQEAVERLAGVHEFGMEPDVIAQRTLDAMRENRLHIFSHPDHKEEMREIFDEIIDEYRDYPKDNGHDQRVAFEGFRRDMFAKARAASRASDF